MKYVNTIKKILCLLLTLCMTLSLFTTKASAKEFDATRFDKRDVEAVNAIMKSTKLADGFDWRPLWEEQNNAPSQWKFVTWDDSTPKRVASLDFTFNMVSGALDVSKLTELTRLTCNEKDLTSINVKGLTKLTRLKCASNSLTSLDLTGCAALTELYCDNNQLKSLDVSKQTLLEKIVCESNPLTTLDVSGLKSLTELSCNDCNLSSLKVSGAAALSKLDCVNNNLTSLDISNTYLGLLDCRNNKFASPDAIVGTDAENLATGVTTISFDPQNIILTATPTASKVLVNGKSIAFDAYTIYGNNYFKLRDLAKVLSGTSKQFDVSWNGEENAMNLISGQSYTPVGGELAKGDGKAKPATYSTANVLLNNDMTALTAYTIGGNNYFKLRDIMQVFNVGVGWDSTTSTITIDTSIAYAA